MFPAETRTFTCLEGDRLLGANSHLRGGDLSWKPATDLSMMGTFSAVCQSFAHHIHGHLPSGRHIGLLGVNADSMAISAFMHRHDVSDCDHKPTFGTEEAIWQEVFYLQMRSLMPSSVSGFLWWQGESDSTNGQMYACTFPLFIRRLRSEFESEHAPFVFARIPGWGWNVGTHLPDFREVQMLATSMNGVGFVPTEDIPCSGIHPVNKDLIGARMANSMRGLLLDHRVHWRPPMLSHAEWDISFVLLHITHVSTGGRLTVQRHSACVQDTWHSNLYPFPGASTFDGNHWSAAELLLVGERTLLVQITNATTAISFGYANEPDLHIYDNMTQLPLLAWRVTR